MTSTVGASTSLKSLTCYVHFGGVFSANVEGEVRYNCGSVRVRSIKEGISIEELRAMLGGWLGIDGDRCDIKYTLRFDDKILVDLVDDCEVENLFKYNESSAHLYVACKGSDEVAREIDERDGGLLLIGDSEKMSCVRREEDVRVECSEPPLLRLTCEDQMTQTLLAEKNSQKWMNLLVGVNQLFAHSDEFKKVLHKFSIAHKFEYKYVKNNRECVDVKCKVEGCPWRIVARSAAKSNPFLRVTRYSQEHIHTTQDNLEVTHAQSACLTSSIIVEEVRDQTDLGANAIKKSLSRDYGVQLTYKQAYRAKDKAMEEIHGRREHSYMLIPWICQRLKETDEKTVAEWVASGNMFERVFIAYGCSIEGFLAGARPLLYIDGTHLSGPYQGTLLAASAFDANNDLLPFAMAIVSAETNAEWTWFLEMIKKIVGSLQVTIVSDRHKSIIYAVGRVFGSERHAYCYRHVKENFSAQMLKLNILKRKTSGQGRETGLALLDEIAYARLDSDFDKGMERMWLFNKEIYDWLINHGDVHKWAMSKFPFKRWDKITTNLAESFNAWMVKERRHNVAQLIHEHRDKIARKMYAASIAMEKWKNGVGPNIEQQVMENVTRAEFMEVELYGGGRVKVITASGELKVELYSQECTCRAWQMSGIPCPHACAAIKGVHGNVYDYVDECYKLCSQKKIYSKTMILVVTIDMPHPNDYRLLDIASQPFLLPPKTSRPAGRPKVARKESQFQNKKIYKCSLCETAGHTRRTCKNPNPN